MRVLLRPVTAFLSLLAALVIVGAFSASASAATNYPMPTEGQGRVSASSVTTGGCTTFSGSGYQPGTTVVISDDGKPVKTVPVNSDGTFSTPVCFGTSAHLGRHTLTATGIGGNGAARTETSVVTVLGAATTEPVTDPTGVGGGSGNGLPFTGVDVVAMAGVGLVLVFLGAGFFLGGSRRGRDRSRATA